jgi:hypothetical protein
MRTCSIALMLMMTAGSPLAASAPDNPHKSEAVRHAFQKPKPKTAGNPIAAPSPDPDAGVSDNGAPNGAVVNGGQLAH